MFARRGYIRKCIASVLCLAGAIGFAQAGTVRSGEIYAEGAATIMHGDRDAARQRALADALNQASLSMGARVLATEHLDATDVALQSQQIRSTRQISGYSILREWEDQAVYHVAVSAEGVLDEAAAEHANSMYAVKKKIVFFQFDASSTVQLDDIRNVYSELPQEISKRMEAGGGVLVDYVDGFIPKEPDALQRETVMRVARETGAQFLVSGSILDAGINKTNGFWGTSLGKKNVRHFRIELVVHDGLTGTRLFSHRLEGDAQGDVEIGGDKPFGGGAFLGTESGRVLDRLMEAAAKDIRAGLACLPFSARVVRVEGKSVYLDAGAVSMLKAGDKLVIYNTDLHLPLVTAGGSELGLPERQAATVTLVKMQPLLSVGELPEDAAKLGVKTGSIARFEFSEKMLQSPACLQ